MDRETLAASITSLGNRAHDACHFDSRTGWYGVGQFFDPPKDHMQVGAFGCAAAALAIGGTEPNSRSITKLLNAIDEMWSEWHEGGTQGRRFVQTYKLAYVLLALNVAQVEGFGGLKSDVRARLLKMQLPTGGWSSWWISDDSNGELLDVPSTAMAVLALSYGEQQFEGCQDSVARLNEFLDRYPDVSMLKICLCLAALSRVDRADRNPNFERILNSVVASGHKLGTSEPYHYYVYRYYDNEGIHRFGRDVIVAPPTITAALAAFGNSATPISRLRGQRLADKIAADIRKGGSLYRFEHDQFAGSMVQGLAALSLREARTSFANPPWIVRAHISVFSDRPRDSIWYRVVPTIAVVSAVVLTVYTADKALIWKLTAALFTLFVGSIWGPIILRRWLPGA